MNERILREALSSVPLGGFRYFERVGSTNDAALAWASAGAPDLSLVYAEEQTAGRGRGSRRWFTPAGAALAFSLVLRPLPREVTSIPHFSALGALAVCEALAANGLEAEIKWPNDVLLDRRKVCGILAESVWTGEKVDCIVLGVGVNIRPGSVPPAEDLLFPATCLEAERTCLGQPIQTVERAALLGQILQAALTWRSRLAEAVFLQAWENRLAFRGEMVELRAEGVPARTGRVDGLEKDGSLRLLSPQGQPFMVQFGEVHVRPVV
jgi:BirA family transcriptional regulator, biotin operon repressor / biotin---[acetyl-CoA-carboxylase] ligase